MVTRNVIRELSQQIRQIERSRSHSVSSANRVAVDLPGVDGLIGEPSWPRGCLVEFLAEGCGAGSASLALLASRAAWRDALLIVIDSRRELYVPAAVVGDECRADDLHSTGSATRRVVVVGASVADAGHRSGRVRCRAAFTAGVSAVAVGGGDWRRLGPVVAAGSRTRAAVVRRVPISGAAVAEQRHDEGGLSSAALAD